MIATLLAMGLFAGSPDEPKPPAAHRTIAQPSASTAAKAKAEVARRKQERNRLRALNSRLLAGMDGSGSNSSRGTNTDGFGNPGGYSAGAGNYGGFGGGWADPGLTSAFEQQLASTFIQVQGAMAAGQAALEASASLS
jgi:hypothetical protein